MIDQTVAKLVLDVQGGKVEALAPLLDLLAENHDVRLRHVCRLIGSVQDSLPIDLERISKRRRSAEEMAHRANEARFGHWAHISNSLGELFYVELHGVPDLAALAELGAQLDAPKQAARLARATESGGAEEYPAEDMGEMQGGCVRAGQAKRLRRVIMVRSHRYVQIQGW